MDLKQLKDEELCALLEKRNVNPKEPILVELFSRPLDKGMLYYLLEYLEHVSPGSKFFYAFWDRYRGLGLNNFELAYVINTYPSLRSEAIILLCGRNNLEASDYLLIIKFSEANKAEAQERLKDLRAKKINVLESVGDEEFIEPLV
jgi:hypothetical protein